jgi:hypothetical protein
MRKAFFTFVMGLSGCIAGASSVHASIFALDPNGGGDSFIPGVGALDWSPDNALSKDGLTAIRAFIASGGAVQLPFDTFAQARLGSINDGSGNIIPLPPGYGEITFVAGITEVVTAASLTPGVASFASFAQAAVPTANYFEVYYQAVPNASQINGTGYNDGLLIMSGTADSITSTFSQNLATAPSALDQSPNGNNYPALSTLTGNGSTSISGTIGYIDPNFFSGLVAGSTIQFFTTNQTDPFRQADPSKRFAELPGGVAPILDGAGSPATSIGTLNGNIAGTAPDIQYQTDATSSFTVAAVPEASAVLIWSIIAIVAAPFAVVLRRNAIGRLGA